MQKNKDDAKELTLQINNATSCVPSVASFSGLSIFFYCPFGIL